MTTSKVHVARLGGLAVALGIGAAVTNVQAVALAAPSNTSPDSSSGSSAAAQDPSSNSPQKDGTPRATHPRRRAVPGAGTTDPTSPGPTAATPPTNAASKNRSPFDRKPALDASAGAQPTSTGTVTGTAGGAGEPEVDTGSRTPAETADAQPTAPDRLPQNTTQTSPSVSVANSTPVDNQPVIARAAQAAAPGVVTSLLATVGLSHASTSTPSAPGGLVSTLLGVLDVVRREIQRTFFNQTPTYSYNPVNNSLSNGSIVGTLIPTDPDSTTLTFTATQPAHGLVTIDPQGTFVYTPDASYSGQDSFNVTVSDADSGFHIHGLPGLLHLLTFGLLGNSGHTYTSTITVSGDVPPPTGLRTGFGRTAVVSGLNTPTDFRFLPDNRILIAQKGGSIVVANSAGQVQSTPVITLPTDGNYARGLEGIAVDPNFKKNGYVYVAYINANDIETLSRITVSNPSSDVLTADPTSEVVLLQGNQPAAADHFGGTLQFGSDGALYWGVGDNGYFPPNNTISQNAQDRSNIYGKILRINPDGTVPQSNPFVNTPGVLPQIYAYGFRNPFRGSMTPNGQLLVGDVGQSTWEEIDLVQAGGNYGWPLAEGTCPGAGVCDPSVTAGQFINPSYAYNHDGGSNSITSVLPYTSSTFGPSYQHMVFFADFSRGWIEHVTCNADYSSCGNPMMFDPQAGRTVQLLQGPDGDIYQLTFDGTLSRIAPSAISDTQSSGTV